ncbi:sugar ABC transporter ATP-binding protein [Burkholderia sp. SCN-KJ]|uniref:sugar ABC transporter ATP-binding protein n=1 Tax=Burkholderia sp. SCN-KJ TaxID=2969248 RepID=UPI0021502ABD|nr:sugar ABC transporter ATP-binding protein [Burkholderia sp. SCN-KJ]MCR4471585.1 sugar ABC transporter ATP-binding protein [Burkholderia sp. SCN-KJ]
MSAVQIQMRPAPPISSVARVEDVSKSFGPTKALTDVRLLVSEGRSHALLGRNGAGKSTLVSVLTGLQIPDSGSVTLYDQPAPNHSDRAAWLSKVACVYQRACLAPSLSVAENLFFNRTETSGRGVTRINWRRLYERADALLREWGLETDPRIEAGKLSVEESKLVELTRALSFGCRFIILDEPTAGLDRREVDALISKITALRERGITFLYISHYLEEIFQICQDVTVLRDGRSVLSASVADLSQARLVEAMVGPGEFGGARVRHAGCLNEDKKNDQPVVLDVSGLNSKNQFSDIDLQIRRGQILGLAGLAGSGKDHFAMCLAGLVKPDSGSVTLDGVRLMPGDVAQCIRAGIGFVGKNRHHDGFASHMSIEENASMSIMRDSSCFGVVNFTARRKYAARCINDLSIRAQSGQQSVAELSGGNQQKVVFARALASNPKVLILVNPLAGVDVASNRILYEAVVAVAKNGTAVLIVSDELSELEICDSVQVMFKGRLTDQLQAGWAGHELVSSIEGVGVEG